MKTKIRSSFFKVVWGSVAASNLYTDARHHQPSSGRGFCLSFFSTLLNGMQICLFDLPFYNRSAALATSSNSGRSLERKPICYQ